MANEMIPVIDLGPYLAGALARSTDSVQRFCSSKVWIGYAASDG